MVNINPAYRRSELEYVLDKVGVQRPDPGARIQVERLYRHPAGRGAGDSHAPGQLQSARLPHLRHVIRLGEIQRRHA
jgi:fatty-acyl-CoA synthase